MRSICMKRRSINWNFKILNQTLLNFSKVIFVCFDTSQSIFAGCTMGTFDLKGSKEVCIFTQNVRSTFHSADKRSEQIYVQGSFESSLVSVWRHAVMHPHIFSLDAKNMFETAIGDTIIYCTARGELDLNNYLGDVRSESEYLFHLFCFLVRFDMKPYSVRGIQDSTTCKRIKNKYVMVIKKTNPSQAGVMKLVNYSNHSVHLFRMFAATRVRNTKKVWKTM